MADLRGRLVRCFSSVFPTLTEEEIEAANVALLIDLDSLTAVTLVALIDEEFGVDMDPDDLMNLGNFQAVQQRLLEYATSGAPPGDQRAK